MFSAEGLIRLGQLSSSEKFELLYFNLTVRQLFAIIYFVFKLLYNTNYLYVGCAYAPPHN